MYFVSSSLSFYYFLGHVSFRYFVTNMDLLRVVAALETKLKAWR